MKTASQLPRFLKSLISCWHSLCHYDSFTSPQKAFTRFRSIFMTILPEAYLWGTLGTMQPYKYRFLATADPVSRKARQRRMIQSREHVSSLLESIGSVLYNTPSNEPGKDLVEATKHCKTSMFKVWPVGQLSPVFTFRPGHNLSHKNPKSSLALWTAL